MRKIVECVPNFSEGRDTQKIARIADEIKKVEDIRLLNVESDSDYNRTVITFAGPPDAVKKAAFSAIKVASEVIDMSQHRGEHPRIGATDVCPFIPVSNVTMEECIQIARSLGGEVGENLGIPVYIYGDAATVTQRHLLPDIRKGEYEGLSEKMKEEDWKPDFGPEEFNSQVKKTGATVIGTRDFLIAYNINLNTNNTSIANKISGMIRTSGVMKKDEKGQKTRIPGMLKYVQAMGIYLKEYDIAQVSTNLSRYKVTPPHVVFEEIKKLAYLLGVQTTGSEIVGLVPKEALLAAGRFYSTVLEEKRLIDIAVERLGLSQLNKFDPEKKVIEFLLGLD